MSSSAFTPTTTQVTTEVPVNVPVVTAWQDYTPTLSGFTVAGLNALNSGKWRRVGDSMEIVISTRMGSTGSASGVFYWGLPTGYTVDGSKIPPGGSGVRQAPGSLVWYDRSANQFVNAVPSIDQGQNAIWSIVTGNGLPQNLDNTVIPSNADDSFSLSITVPISQWSSGITTLADRAVEEYAWNSSASTTTDTTSFGNGPDGVNIRAFAPSGNTNIEKRVRFQSPVQATDRISLEFNAGSGWALAVDVSGAQASNDSGTVSYGQVIRPVSGSTTDFSVLFNSSNTGQTPWSGLTSWKWRVRKVSGGAQVGYPVSARNIVGDTSGSVVPVGMIGQVVSGASDAATTVAGNFIDKVVTTLSLSSGNWLIVGSVYFDPGGTITTRLQSSISTGTNSGAGTILNILGLDYVEGSFGLSNGYVVSNFHFPANISSQTTFNVNAKITYTGTSSVGSPLRACIRAIRIA